MNYRASPAVFKVATRASPSAGRIAFSTGAMELPSVISKLLGYTPSVNMLNHRMDEEDVKPKQPSNLSALLIGAGEFAVTRKHDGEGVIVHFINGRVTVYTRKAKVPAPYLATLFDLKKLDPDVTSFKIAAEETALFDGAGRFENPPEMPEMGYAQVRHARKFCEGNPDQNAVQMHMFAFRLLDLNGARGNTMNKQDELRLLEGLLRGQQRYHVPVWFSIECSYPSQTVRIKRTTGRQYVNLCPKSELDSHLHSLAGTWEGFVVYSNTDWKTDPPVTDCNAQLRDAYSCKARRLFEAVLQGRLETRNGSSTLVLCADRDRATDVELAYVPFHDLDRSIKAELERNGGKVYLKVQAPNLSITLNARGRTESRLLGTYRYMPVVYDPNPIVTNFEELVAQRPHWKKMDEQQRLFKNFEQTYVQSRVPKRALPCLNWQPRKSQHVEPVRAPPPRPSTPPAPKQAKQQDPSKGALGSKHVRVWQRGFTPMQYLAFKTRVGMLGAESVNSNAPDHGCHIMVLKSVQAFEDERSQHYFTRTLEMFTPCPLVISADYVDLRFDTPDAPADINHFIVIPDFLPEAIKTHLRGLRDSAGGGV